MRNSQLRSQWREPQCESDYAWILDSCYLTYLFNQGLLHQIGTSPATLCLQKNKADYFLLWKDKSDEKIYNMTLGKQTNRIKITLKLSSTTQESYLEFHNEKNFYTYVLQAYSKACITYFTIIINLCIKVMYSNSISLELLNTSGWILWTLATTFPGKIIHWSSNCKPVLHVHIASKVPHNILAIWSL